jgi:uncharacterized membrane protein
MEFLARTFALVCGQNPEHTWAPGGWALPCCQRCTGLYVGALMAVLLLVCFRPRLSGRFLQVHGLFLLQMVPFGFHWLPQGPVARTVTGVLFGFGVVTFLWLVPAARLARRFPTGFEDGPGQKPIGNRRSIARSSAAVWSYGAGFIAGVALLLVIAAGGGAAAARVLAGLAFAGAVVLAGLALANAGIGLLSLARRLHRQLHAAA